jgi:restriction system protein
MTRKKQGLLDELFKFLVTAPWWVGPICITVVYALFRLAIPGILEMGGQDNTAAKTMGSTLAMMSVRIAPYVTGGILFIWAIALLFKLMDRDRFDSQTGLDTIRKLDWVAFERLIGEFYRRQGYRVEVTGSDTGDGGVDVRLRRDEKTTLVQCKHWKARSVGVKPVRELLGVVTSENSHHGIVVTSGSFTEEATEFAKGSKIELIGGSRLAEMIRSVQDGSFSKPPATETAKRPAVVIQATSSSCPVCGSAMRKRMAKQGPHAGQEFWGCSRYPACKGIRQV